MFILLRLSGLFAMVFAWLFVTAPALILGIDTRKQTISSTTKNHNVRMIVSTGLVVGSLFQIIFLIYLLSRFELSVVNMGSILYLSATIATMLVALFPEHIHFKIHNFFVKYYFLMFPTSLLMTTWAIRNENLSIFIFTCFTVFSYFFGAWWTIEKYGVSAKVEQWAFLVLSIWTIVLTLV